MVKDKITGGEREVDILITTRAANYNMAIGIEAVDWNRLADTPWIEKMRAKHKDLKIDKLILVSRKGFTKPAIKKAQFYNIEALTLEAACDTDWPFVAKFGSQGIFKVTDLKYNCFIVYDSDHGKKEQIEAPLHASFSLGEASVTIDEFIRNIINFREFRDAIYQHIQGTGKHDFWFSYTSPGLSRMQIANKGRLCHIQEIRVGLKILTNETIVQNNLGKFQNIPFLEGVSASDDQLHFVVLRTPNGAIRGYMIDQDGTRELSSFDDSLTLCPPA